MAVIVEGKSWGRRVKERREALGLSQDQLADLCSEDGRTLTQQTISKIERDELRPRDRTKELLARTMGTQVGELFPWPVAS